ncbi:glutamate receptor ionotropic, kainate 4, partial [Lates japonicus]
VPYVKVAPEDILKVQFPRFTTLDLRPTNTDISLAVAGLLTFFNSTTACLICAQADCLPALPLPVSLGSRLVGSLLSVARPHVPAPLITQASDSLIERGQFMNIFQPWLRRQEWKGSCARRHGAHQDRH